MLSLLLAVPSCIYSFWHGVIPTSYFIFNDFYTCYIVITPSNFISINFQEIRRIKMVLTKLMEQRNRKSIFLSHSVSKMCVIIKSVALLSPASIGDEEHIALFSVQLEHMVMSSSSLKFQWVWIKLGGVPHWQVQWKSKHCHISRYLVTSMIGMERISKCL